MLVQLTDTEGKKIRQYIRTDVRINLYSDYKTYLDAVEAHRGRIRDFDQEWARIQKGDENTTESLAPLRSAPGAGLVKRA